MKKFKLILCNFLLLFITLTTPVYAEIISESTKTEFAEKPAQIIDSFKQDIEDKSDVIADAARQILHFTLICGIIYIGFSCLFGDANFPKIIMEMIKFLFFGGILIGIMNNISYLIDIILSFSSIPFSAAQQNASITELLGRILIEYLDMVLTRIASFSWRQLDDAAIFFIVALFGFIAITLVIFNYLLTLVQMYFTMYIGVIALAFGGCSLSNQVAISYIKQGVSYALQLMAIMFIAFMMYESLDQYAYYMQQTGEVIVNLILMIFSLAIYALMCLKLPGALASLIGTASAGGLSVLPFAVSAATGIMGAAAKTALKASPVIEMSGRLGLRAMGSAASSIGLQKTANAFNSAARNHVLENGVNKYNKMATRVNNSLTNYIWGK